MTKTEQQRYDELAIPADNLNDNALKFAHIVQLICKDEGVPFNQGWKLAQERFPALHEKISRDRQAMAVAAGSGAASVTGTAVSNGRYSPLLGTDVEKVSPPQARAAINQEVDRLQKERGMSFTSAWSDVKDREPDLMAKSVEDAVERNNAATAAAQMPLPNALVAAKAPRASKPFLLPMLGLPPNATDDEMDVAWTANGAKATDRDSQAILTALLAHLITSRGIKIDEAKDLAKTRYPEIWKVAGDKPVSPQIFN